MLRAAREAVRGLDHGQEPVRAEADLSRPVGAEGSDGTRATGRDGGTGHEPAGRDSPGRDTFARDVGQLRGTRMCPNLMSICETTSEKRAVGRDTFVE